MNAYMDIMDIRKKYNNGDYSCNMFIPRTIEDNHVFDENLSVKQNREMVQECNKKIIAMRKEKNEKNSQLHCKLKADVASYIAHTYGMSIGQANIIEEYVYSEKHHFMGDYFSSIDDVAEMVESVLKEER